MCSDCPSHTPPRTHITQGNNDLGPTGAEKLAGALAKMTGMQTLMLVESVKGDGSSIKTLAAQILKEVSLLPMM